MAWQVEAQFSERTAVANQFAPLLSLRKGAECFPPPRHLLRVSPRFVFDAGARIKGLGLWLTRHFEGVGRRWDSSGGSRSEHAESRAVSVRRETAFQN